VFALVSWVCATCGNHFPDPPIRATF